MKRRPLTVVASDLTPSQRSTSVGFRRQTDCYERYMVKFAGQIAIFHSLAELFHAALLEADPRVTHYIPQPYSLRVGGKPYCPDCFVLRDGQRYIIELKPRGEFDEQQRRSLEAFFERQGMIFQVLANEPFLEQAVLAQNWLMILGQLHTCRDVLTDAQEISLLDELSLYDSRRLGDLIDPGDRWGSLERETALFRLLHRGLVQADLSNAALDYPTEFSVCT